MSTPLPPLVEPAAELTREEVARYSRHLIIPDVGLDGQKRLKNARVLVIGAGGLGSPTLLYLAAAGVGTIGIVEFDVVDESNLQRQIIHGQSDIGRSKAQSAKDSIAEVNPFVDVKLHEFRLEPDNAVDLFAQYDLILDGTDNFATRYLLNDWCALHGVPWIYAGGVAAEGASMVVLPGGPCLRCLWPEPPAAGDVGTCETAGVLAPAIAAVTAFQTAEALKLLASARANVTRGIFTCDVWRGSYHVQRIAAPSGECVVCRRERFPALEAGAPEAVVLCGRDAVQVDPPRRTAVDLGALGERLRPAVDDLERTPHYLRFSVDGCRFSVFATGRALLFGVQDPLRARALYDRWVGVAVDGEP